jgi:hypothetical protein
MRDFARREFRIGILSIKRTGLTIANVTNRGTITQYSACQREGERPMHRVQSLLRRVRGQHHVNATDCAKSRRFDERSNRIAKVRACCSASPRRSPAPRCQHALAAPVRIRLAASYLLRRQRRNRPTSGKSPYPLSQLRIEIVIGKPPFYLIRRYPNQATSFYLRLWPVDAFAI